MAKPKFSAPKGTRDLYQDDLLRRRYVTQTWRDTAIRHGFTEVDGPTFETSDLYAVKSGDGILGELFQAYSGKSADEVAAVQETGRAPFALRPEFTPTLARMYAARAKQLPQPTRWFSIGPFFRAERPQRGRLREFLQWNADVLGDAQSINDRADVLSLLLCAVRSFGLSLPTTLEDHSPNLVHLHFNDRRWTEGMLDWAGVPSSTKPHILSLLDKFSKMTRDDFNTRLSHALGDELVAEYITDRLELERIRAARISDQAGYVEAMRDRTLKFDQKRKVDPKRIAEFGEYHFEDIVSEEVAQLRSSMQQRSDDSWLHQNGAIVRGLAYYTGTVFELIAEGERAVAGGGRYDNLIELLGGPPTPAVGMAMGDVVLMNLLDDLGLMPEGRELLEAVSRPPASLRPDLFIVTPHEELDSHARRLAAELRRSPDAADPSAKPWQRTPGLHVRVTDKATRKVSKLIDDAKANHARRLLILESESDATLTDLDNKDAERKTLPLEAEAIRAAATA